MRRACRTIGTVEAVDVLRRHAAHADRDVGLAVLSSLASIGTERTDDVVVWLSAVIDDEVRHAGVLLGARSTLRSVAGTGPLMRALRDELELTRSRVIAALAAQYGEEAMGRVAVQLARNDPRVQALALEWLDSTLVGGDRAALPMLDGGLTEAEQLNALTRHRVDASPSVVELLSDLIHDPLGVWRRPWLAACAIVAVASNPDLAGGSLLTQADDEVFDSLLVETRDGVLGRGGAVLDLTVEPAVRP